MSCLYVQSLISHHDNKLQTTSSYRQMHVQIMEEQLTQAGLAVPDELDTKSIFETARDKCMAEKAKLAADEKAEGHASPGAAPKGELIV